MKLIITSAFFITSLFLSAQKKTGVVLLNENKNTSIRGVSVPSDDIVWVSGSNGTVGRSLNGGKSWQWMQVTGYEQKDFRDIEAFDSATAIIMAVGNPAYILKTKDGGVTWKKVFERDREGMFLDAMDFKNSKEGICIGDPLFIGSAGRKFFYMINTTDGGDTWKELPMYQLAPVQEPAEAMFAASGSNVAYLPNNAEYEFAFVSGGSISNIYFMGKPGKQNKVVNIPINQGVATAGAFSLATDGNKKMYCIGGQYDNYWVIYDNFYYTHDVGKSWKSPSVAPPNGYRSSICRIDDDTFVCCGTNGVDITFNACKEWKSIVSDGVKGKNGFNTCVKSKTGKAVYFGGDNGKIGKLVIQD